MGTDSSGAFEKNMRLADHSVSLKALPVNALIGLEQTTRFTGGHDLQFYFYKSAFLEPDNTVFHIL
jgi:hypothetical protein